MAAYAPSAGGRSGPGVSQGEGEHNLFREAEKKYQLHWDQRMRSRQVQSNLHRRSVCSTHLPGPML